MEIEINGNIVILKFGDKEIARLEVKSGSPEAVGVYLREIQFAHIEVTLDGSPLPAGSVLTE